MKVSSFEINLAYEERASQDKEIREKWDSRQFCDNWLHETVPVSSSVVPATEDDSNL